MPRSQTQPTDSESLGVTAGHWELFQALPVTLKRAAKIEQCCATTAHRNQKEERETHLRATQVFLETHWAVDLDLSWPQIDLEKEEQDLMLY